MIADPLRSIDWPAARPLGTSTGRPGHPRMAQHFYRDGVHELVLPARDVAGEAEAVAGGPAEFALVEEEPLLLLCHRFGDVIPWSMATYCPWPPRERGRCPAEDPLEARAILHVRLIAPDRDAELARRNVTLSLQFTRALRAALRDQGRFSPDPVELKRTLQRLRRRYPTTDALVGHAAVRTIGSW
jgi:hypothetical protein